MGADEPSDKPFDDEPFDAGVEADEDSDPKKYIEQLTGKLGQSLRKYNESQGQPDYELEKFAINSLLSASHTSEMDENDQSDIIKKVKTAGNNDDNQDNNQSDNGGNDNDDNDNGSDSDGNSGSDFGSDMDSSEKEGDSDLNEEEKTSIFLDKPKKNNMFQIGSNDVLKESCWKGYKAVGMKEKNGKQVPNCVPIDEVLHISKKSSIFDKIKSKLQETFNQDDEKMAEPMTEPAVKPAPVKTPKTTPIAPSRKNKPFLPMPEVQPDPKATK